MTGTNQNPPNFLNGKMAKTLVEKEICDACGADVRPGSLFCYNCGGAVSDEIPEPVLNQQRKAPGGNNFKDDLPPKNNLQTNRLKSEAGEKIELKPIEKPPGTPIINEPPVKSEGKTPEKISIQEEAKLKSAANLRRKAKIYRKKTVEVVWEEPDNAPNKWFPIVAVVLILFVILIFYLAMYLK